MYRDTSSVDCAPILIMVFFHITGNSVEQFDIIIAYQSKWQYALKMF